MVRWYVFTFSVKLSSARRIFSGVLALFGASDRPTAMLKLESTDRHLRMNQLGLSFCMGSPVRGLLFLAHTAAVLASVPGVLGTKKTVIYIDALIPTRSKLKCIVICPSQRDPRIPTVPMCVAPRTCSVRTVSSPSCGASHTTSHVKIFVCGLRRES